MKFLITTALAILLCFTAFATAQYPDKIIYNGKEYKLHSNPLETYFEKFPDKRPKGSIMSTALWRGYVATFEIKDSQLLLKDIQIQYWDTTNRENHDNKWKSVMNEVFPDQKIVKVDWLTGLIVLPHGKLINYVHMGYGSTYENYFLLEINKGEFIKAKRFNYKEYEKFKDKQFLAYKQTDDYKKIKTDLKKDGTTEEFIDNFLRNFITQYTTKLLTN